MAEVKTEYDPTTGGNKKTVEGGVPNRIEVERKKGGLARGIGKFIAWPVGIFGMLLSAVLFVTIIGIPIAIGLFFASLGIIYATIGKQKVECPNCGKKNFVLQTKENFECPKCKQLTVVDWR